MQAIMVEKDKNNDVIINDMYNQISDIITNNKNKINYQKNNTLVDNNFMIGKIIVENEQNGNIRAEYGKEILNKLSKKGQTINNPTDILKEPYVFEFLDIKEDKPLLESDLVEELDNLILHNKRKILEGNGKIR